MPSDSFASLIALVLVVVACAFGAAAAVRRVARAVRMRNAPPTGLIRAGAPAGTEDPAVAAQRAEGTTAWTRISGGGF